MKSPIKGDGASDSKRGEKVKRRLRENWRLDASGDQCFDRTVESF